MVEYSDEVEKLAETLKNSGLAASMEDALERAQSMLGKKEEKEEVVEKEEDVAQTTLGEVNRIKDSNYPSGIKESKKKADEPDESPETEEELKKEQVFTNNPGNEQKQESNQNKVDYTREKKVDRTEVFDVNK